MTTFSYVENQDKCNKNILMIFIAIFFIVCSFSAEEKTNFSGVWRLNEGKSEMGEGRSRRAASQLTVKQDENELIIDRLTVRSSGEEFRSTEKLSLDGSECTNIVFGDREKKSTATWSEDKKTLHIWSEMTFEREGEQMTIHTTEIWSISDDGLTLTIDYASTSPQGERKNKFVYDKE